MARPTWSLSGPMRIAALTTLVMIVGIGTWSVQTEISGAVIGRGQVSVAQSATVVQHPVGGVISDILVRNGDQVSAGDILILLDGDALRADLGTIEDELFETLSNLARLEAVVESRNDIVLHPVLEEAALERPDIAHLVDRQLDQLFAHFHALETEKHLLREQIGQVAEQVAGVQAELDAEIETYRSIAEELVQKENLASRNLVPLNDLLVTRRESFKSMGRIGQLNARSAELKGKISELELQLSTLEPELQQKASEELSQLRPARTKFLNQRNRKLTDLEQLEIRAPVSGIVHDSKIEGIRSVVVAAKPLMHIIPSQTPTLVKIRIDSSNIDQIHVGQKATLRFMAFNRRTTPQIFGAVQTISADAFSDATTRRTYYDVTVSLSPEELKRLGDQRIVPGMPVDAFIETQPRTPLAYVTQPVLQYFDHAFRDS